MLKKMFTHHWAVNFTAGFIAWRITDWVGYEDWSKPIRTVIVSFGIYIVLTGGYGLVKSVWKKESGVNEVGGSRG
jgi:hypothetical protein